MLEKALRARLPIIAVRTRDPMNAQKILSSLAGAPVKIWGKTAITEKSVYVAEKIPDNLRVLYSSLQGQDSVLVLVNPDPVPVEAWDAGTLMAPRSLIEATLLESAVPEMLFPMVIPTLGGLTLKEIGECVVICQSQHGYVSAEKLMSIRRQCFSSVRGLMQVATEMEFYSHEPKVEKWIKDCELFFKSDEFDSRLVPRGLLMSGPPGTGKSMAAKYLAGHLQVPLFRLDLGVLKSKYVGESEANLNAALAAVDADAPCVLLIDEVEKLFQTHDESGVSQSLLATLLWWLAEHRTHVLTVMTTNDPSVIPSELYRPGRIDREFTFTGLTKLEAGEFVDGLVVTFDSVPWSADDTSAVLVSVFGAMQRVPHARITLATLERIQKILRETSSSEVS